MFSKGMDVAVMVSDAKKSAKWYKEKLDFNVSDEDEHWVTAWPKGATWKLHLCKGKLEKGNTGIGLFMPDVEKVAAELKKRGVKFSQPVTKNPWGVTAMIEDLDGNGLWLMQGGP